MVKTLIALAIFLASGAFVWVHGGGVAHPCPDSNEMHVGFCMFIAFISGPYCLVRIFIK